MSLNNFITSFAGYDYNEYDPYRRHESNASWFDSAAVDGTNTPNILKLFDTHTPDALGTTYSSITTSPRNSEDFLWMWGNGNEFRVNEYFESNTFSEPIVVSDLVFHSAIFGVFNRLSIEVGFYNGSWHKFTLISKSNPGTWTPAPLVENTLEVNLADVTKFRIYFACSGVSNAGPRAVFDTLTINGFLKSGLTFSDGSTTKNLCFDESSPLKLYDGSSIRGIALVDISSSLASKYRFFDGTQTRALAQI